MNKTTFVYAGLLMLIFLPGTLLAQISVSGKITDASSGEGLYGVNVLIQGTGTGTTSDLDGSYQLSVPDPGAVLIFTYTGYETQNVTISGAEQEPRDIVMVESALQLKDVVVTANRVEENLQQIPVAATVLTGIDLRSRSATNSLDALSSTPGLIFDAYTPGSISLSLRGIATNLENAGIEQGIGMYVNDVYQSRPFGFNATLMDVERVEVLRGPQGTLFGKNTVGGVVHIITEDPKMNHSGAVELGVGSNNFFQLRAKANVMLAPEKLALRLGGAMSKRKAGFVDHDASTNKMDFMGLKASLLYRASDKVDALLDVNWSEDKSGEVYSIYLGYDADNPEERPEDRRTEADQPFDWSRDQFSSSLRVRADLGGDHSLNIISAYGRSSDAGLQESDWSPAAFVNFSHAQEFSTFTQEVRINSGRDRTFAYVAGLFYANETITGSDAGYFLEPLIPAVIAPLFGLPDGFTIPGYEESSTTDAETKSNSFSIFGSGTYRLNEQLKLTAGLRFISENKDLTIAQTHIPHQGGVEAFGFPLVTAFFPDFGSKANPEQFSQTDNALSGNLSLEYTPSENVLTYLSFARGYKGSGFNFTENAVPSEQSLIFAPETVNNYEVGLKSKIGSRMRFNLAGYVMKYFDKQELVVEATSTRVANAPESNGWGLEAELSAILAKGLQLDVSGAILDFEYADFPFATDQTNPEPGVPVNLEGNKLSKVPENTWSISPQYTTKLGTSGKLLVRLDLNHTGDSFNDILNTMIIRRKAATLLNARLGFDFNHGKYGIALWGKNMTDEAFVAGGVDLIFGANGQLNARRVFGVDLRVAFY